MPEPQATSEVIIVGAGVAGLSCARHLLACGVQGLSVLEADNDVGGRVRTDVVEGPGGTYRLDRGFQVFLPAYPEAHGLLDLAALDLRPLVTGAWCRTVHGWAQLVDPRSSRSLRAWWRLARCPALTPLDVLAAARHLWPLTKGLPAGTVDGTTAQWLERCGFSRHMLRDFWRPFLGGVLLDRSLSAPADFTRFTLAMFALGGAAIPARGIGEIPRQLAAPLPHGCVSLRTRVVHVEPGQVLTEDGRRLHARAVVVATDAIAARKLLPGREWPDMPRRTTCLYFAADIDPVGVPVLLLDGLSGGPVNHAAVMSTVSPALAPSGRALICANLLEVRSDGTLPRLGEVLAQLENWFGRDVRRWTLLRAVPIPHALPAVPASPADPRITPGLFVAGDHAVAPSVNGALASGRRAAEAVWASLISKAARG